MILSFSNNELITSYESECILSNAIQLHTTKILCYDTGHDFQTNLSHQMFSSNLSDRVSQALETLTTDLHVWLVGWLCLTSHQQLWRRRKISITLPPSVCIGVSSYKFGDSSIKSAGEDAGKQTIFFQNPPPPSIFPFLGVI